MSDRRKHNTKIRHAKKCVVSVALPPISPEFAAYREKENREQNRLAAIEAQVDDVARAVVRWLLANPSAKERPYFLSLQERLAKLTEIIARLVKRESLSTDWQAWPPTLAEARSLLKEAGQSDEVLAGLPNELPDLTPAQNSAKATPSVESEVANKQQKPLTEREQKIWEVIQRGQTGRQYCREVDNAGVRPRRTGPWKDGPGTYLGAYDEGGRWRQMVQDEKSKIRQKAEQLEKHSPASKNSPIGSPA